MSAETDRAATPARGVVQRSKHLREHPGSRCEEDIACKVLQGMYAPACAPAVHQMDDKGTRASRVELISKCGRKSTSKAKTTDLTTSGGASPPE